MAECERCKCYIKGGKYCQSCGQVVAEREEEALEMELWGEYLYNMPFTLFLFQHLLNLRIRSKLALTLLDLTLWLIIITGIIFNVIVVLSIIY
mgnify:CR=1 FL=1